jgi:hypothetical protein
LIVSKKYLKIAIVWRPYSVRDFSWEPIWFLCFLARRLKVIEPRLVCCRSIRDHPRTSLSWGWTCCFAWFASNFANPSSWFYPVCY